MNSQIDIEKQEGGTTGGRGLTICAGTNRPAPHLPWGRHHHHPRTGCVGWVRIPLAHLGAVASALDVRCACGPETAPGPYGYGTEGPRRGHHALREIERKREREEKDKGGAERTE